MKGQRPRFHSSVVLFLAFGFLAEMSGVTAAAQSRWNMIGPPGGDVYGIAVNPLDTREMYAAVYSLPAQIYRSEDSGQNWRLTAVLDSYPHAIAIAPSSPNILYVLGDASVFKSSDRGATWKEFPLGSARKGEYGEIAVSRTNPDLVYACGYYNDASRLARMAVFKSSDGGETWSVKAPSSSSDSGYSLCLAVDPTDDSVIYVGGAEGGGRTARLFKSANGGESWTAIIGSIQGCPDAIAIDATNPSRLFVGSSWGIYLSGDGGQSWLSSGVSSPVTAVATDAADPNLVVAGSTETCYRSADGGANWSAYKIGLRGECRGLYSASSQLLYASSAGVYRSSDGGISWSESRTGIAASQVAALAIGSDQPNVLYTAVVDDAYYKSDTLGLIWERLPDFASCNDVRKIAVDPANADRVFIVVRALSGWT